MNNNTFNVASLEKLTFPEIVQAQITLAHSLGRRMTIINMKNEEWDNLVLLSNWLTSIGFITAKTADDNLQVVW